jgi:hypothetical protein
MKNQKVVELYQTLQARFELCNDSSQKSNSVIQLISAKCQQRKNLKTGTIWILEIGTKIKEAGSQAEKIAEKKKGQ